MIKFSCEKVFLQNAIAVTSRAVAQKSSIPALEGLLIHADQQLTISGYNMQTGIRTNVFANVVEGGDIVLNARLFGDIIRRLPEGYDTVLSDTGGALSAGQRQLLCIARVMLTDPAILLLDEATSSIDTRTELQVQAAFDELMAGRTSFVVAHRLSTIRNADCILVMRDGNIVEQGTHSELLARGGFYAALYNSQFEDVVA